MTDWLSDRRFSRRSMLRSSILLGAGLAIAPSVVSCATPTGRPGPTTVSLGLNRALNTLDNKLLQYDAAVTVQRAVRQGLTEIDANLKPRLVLADQFRLVDPPAGMCTSGRVSATPTVPRCRCRMWPQRCPCITGRRIVRRGLLPGMANRGTDRRRQFHPAHQAAGSGARLPDVEHPHHPGGSQQTRGPFRRCRHRPLRGDPVRPRAGHLYPGAQREVLGRSPTRGISAGSVHA